MDARRSFCFPLLCVCAALCGLAPASAQQRSENTDDHAAVDPRTLFADPTRENYRLLAAEVETNLKQQVLANWYPRALDVERGGFIQNLNEDWTPAPGGAKGIVYESRLTWTAAKAAQRFPEKSALYSDAAREGLKFLAGKMWDSQHGGFYWSVDPTGNPTRGRGGSDGSSKQAYGNAFGIYAAAAVYELHHDPAALELVQKGFNWYDEHGHDAEHGGYFEILTAEGTPNPNAIPAVGGPPGAKSMNSTVHMLEALTAVYRVWPDPKVRARLRELFEIVRDKMVRDPGYLVQFFTADWQPKPNDDSYGHDVEVAYLLTEAAEALEIPNDPDTWEAAKKLVDHAMQVGWDNTNGGLFNSGGIDGGNFAPTREWWVEAELLNALLLMHQRYGKNDPRYWDAFLAQWNWINQFGLDKTHGGWWPRVRNDGMPVHGLKSDAWTECYHQGRALLNVSQRLRKLADDAPIK
jgi:cellobiose epimerase